MSPWIPMYLSSGLTHCLEDGCQSKSRNAVAKHRDHQAAQMCNSARAAAMHERLAAPMRLVHGADISTVLVRTSAAGGPSLCLALLLLPPNRCFVGWLGCILVLI